MISAFVTEELVTLVEGFGLKALIRAGCATINGGKKTLPIVSPGKKLLIIGQSQEQVEAQI